MRGQFRWLIPILLLSIFALWVSLPDTKISNVQDSCYKNVSGGAPTQGIHLDFDGNCIEEVSLNVRQSLGLDIIGGLRVLLEANLPPGSYTAQNLQDAANNVSKRVDALGVGSATVQVQGSSRILIELPGVTDSCQAIDTIQKTALLEFVDFSGLGSQATQFTGQKILTDKQLEIQGAQEQTAAEATPEATVEATTEATAEATTEATAEATLEATPEATAAAEATPEATVEPATAATTGGTTSTGGCGTATTTDTTADKPPIANPQTGQPFHTVMTGSGLQAAAAQQSSTGQWQIQFQLTSDGSTVFGPYTGSHIGDPMAIVLDGVVLSAPVIQAQLPTGGVITGNFNESAAKQLALQLRSGSLPIPLRVLSSETVGATLGQESVNLSVRAGVVGVIIVLSFMLINYRVPGIAASLALLVFIALNLAVFKLIPVTLTLPAIVGFLISIGTAVDGNILIFERMREEIRAGKDVDTAVEEGFTRAWTSIRDSNLSTIIISLILFLFGQTPGASVVSGFAVTLILGLVLNLFTAIIVTRTFLHVLLLIFRRPIQQRAWLLGV
jgi:preprotein translocase subunit SecD